MTWFRLPLVAALCALPFARAWADDPPPPDPALDLARMRAELDEDKLELEAMKMAALEKELEQQKEPLLRLYGFMDMGLQRMFVKEDSLGTVILQSDASTFVVGNINLYLDAQPSEGWRGLAEVRLTNAPNGADTAGFPGQPYRRQSTEVLDPTNSSGGWAVIRWGSIILERAHIDWRRSDYLNLRVGLFLTPAGIWNVDHGSPTLIALMMPQFLVIEMFPQRQTGLQLFGTHHFAPWALDYTLYVSNGRLATQLDPTEDKAIGGRFVLRRSGASHLALGTSFYVNRFSDQKRQILPGGTPYTVDREEMVAYHEQAVGVDVSADLGPLRLRAEGALRHVVYDEGKRAAWFGFDGFYLSDRNELDAYVLAAYQLPWLGLEPFVNFEFQRSANLLGEGQAIPSVGMNVHFTPAITLKAQVAKTFFWGDWASSDTDVVFAAARAVLAF